MHYLPDKTPKHSPLWLWTWLTCWDRSQSWPESDQKIREFFYQNNLSEASELLDVRNHPGLIGLFSNPLHCHQIDTQTLWNLPIGASVVNAKHYSMMFPNFWWSELLHNATFLRDPNLVHSRQNLKQKAP